MTSHTSSIATQVLGTRDPKGRRTRVPWGYLIHTTGGGVTALARKEAVREAAGGKKARTPLQIAIAVYKQSQIDGWGGPHYVMDHDGSLHQIMPDNVVANHAGGTDRTAYMSGAWAARAGAAEAARQWHRAWPGKKNPYVLFPSSSPNTDYVGVEMIPCGDGFGGAVMAPDPGQLAGPFRFTEAQHGAAALLGMDLARRHGWPPGWQATGRLVGHEDVQPLRRCDSKGGWDPGYLRAAPYFDTGYVRTLIALSASL